MKFKFLITTLLTLLGLSFVPDASATFTFVQVATGTFCAGGSTSCSVTVTSTGAGHLGYIFSQYSNATALTITSVTGGGGTWVIPASCNAVDSNSNGTACAYVLSTASGATTLTVNFSGASANGIAVSFYEESFTGGSVVLDSCGTISRASSSTSQLGVALTISGTNDVIFQGATVSTSTTAISSPYGHLDGFTAAASLENTVSGTAPTWTLSPAGIGEFNACAFSELSSAVALGFNKRKKLERLGIWQ